MRICFQEAVLTYRGPRTASLVPGLTRRWRFMLLPNALVWIDLGHDQALVVSTEKFAAWWGSRELPAKRQ